MPIGSGAMPTQTTPATATSAADGAGAVGGAPTDGRGGTERRRLAEIAPATAGLQEAIDRAGAEGGGSVVVPAGVHRTGALRLRSNVELHLLAGATLQFVPDPSLYPVVRARWEGAEEEVYSPCLYAHGETGVAITGFGTIDGGGAEWWDLFRNRREELAHARPTLIGLHGCTRVTVRDVALRNSPSWTVHPALCEGVTITNVTIVNPADSPNTDGIDPESCRNVRISDCLIDVGDDCIAVKAGTERADARVTCENVTISNCVMVHGHGGVVLGSEMSGGIRNVVITGCVLQGTDRGLRIKTRRGRGGSVEDVRVANVVMDDVLCPIAINPYYFCGPGGREPWVADRAARPVDEATPAIRGIYLAHVTARGVNASAGWIAGLPESPLRDLTLDDVVISFARDPRPGAADMAEGIGETVRDSLRLSHVLDGELSRVRIDGAAGPAIVTQGCEGLRADLPGA